MSIHNWTHVRFTYPTRLLWAFNVVLFFLYMLDVVEAIEFQILTWLILLTVTVYVISVTTIPSEGTGGISRTDKTTIMTFTMVGFIGAFVFQIGIQLIHDLRFQFSILETDWMVLFLGVTAAINEEVFRWSALRLFGYHQPQLRVLPGSVHGIGASALITGGMVNTLWMFFHAKSYVSAPAVVWASLWISGMIITISLYYSKMVLVAIAIHSLWNIAVVLKLATILTGVIM